MSSIGLPRGMSPEDAYVQGIADTEKVTIKVTRRIVDDIFHSFILAMAGHLDNDVIMEIRDVVYDYIDSHYDDRWDRLA